MPVHDPVLEQATQSESAYLGLRELVTAGKCPPGAMLGEQILAKKVGVGRAPMREAVARLVHEGLLVRLPRKGVMVKTLTIDEIRDLYDLRECIEQHVLRRAVMSMPESKIRQVRSDLERAKTFAADGGSWLSYQALDRQFHSAIWEEGHNARSTAVLTQLADTVVLDESLYVEKRSFERIMNSVTEHEAILDAIERRDPAGAAEAMSYHVLAYQRTIIERITLPGSADK